MKNIIVKVGDLITSIDKKIGEISKVSPDKINPHLHFAVYYLNTNKTLVSVNRAINARHDSKIEVIESLKTSSTPLITGDIATIYTTLKNTGGKNWVGHLVVALYDEQGRYITDLPNSFIGTLSAGKTVMIGKLSNTAISSFAGTYKLLTKKLENGVWTILEAKVIEIVPASNFTKQNMTKFRGVSLYTDKNENNLVVLDLREGATLNFLFGKSDISTLDIPYAFMKQEIMDFFNDEKKIYPGKIVAVFNGQFFGPKRELLSPLPPYGTLSYTVYNNKKNYGELLNPTLPSTLPYSQFLRLVFDKQKAKIEKIYDDKGKKYDLDTPEKGIVAYTINQDYDKEENKTLIAGVDTDGNKNDFEKLVVFVGKSTSSNIDNWLKNLGVRIVKESTYIDADIIYLDGGDSSQLHGYDNDFNTVEYRKSEQNSFVELYYGKSPRKIPQAISILCGADYTNPNARQSAADSVANPTLLVAETTENSEDLKIYPNPNSDGLVQVAYTLPEYVNNELVYISVQNYLGVLVHQQKMSGSTGELQLNLGNQKGAYVVRVQAGTYQASKKIIVE